MKLQSARPDTESAAHCQRVAELAQRLIAQMPLPADRALELCTGFDEAVEGAACEGRSIDEAISEFILDGWGPERVALAGTAGYFSPIFHLDASTMPVMPKAVSRLLRTTEETTSTLELEKIAATDPVLSGRLLGAANSAQFGSKFEILHLREAILRVGVPHARRIALACCFAGLFASKPLKELWEHSEAVAGITLELARLCGLDAETAWIGGLLHDIGRLGLMRFPAERRAAEESWLASGFPRVYAETLAFGVDHAALGAAILREWELPALIVDAVALHHRPGRSESLLGATLCLAEDLSAADADMPPEDLWLAMRRKIACERAGITLDRLQAFNELRHQGQQGLACA